MLAVSSNISIRQDQIETVLVAEFLADPEVIRSRPNTQRQYRWAPDLLIWNCAILLQSCRELAPVLTNDLDVESRRQMVKHLRRFYAWCIDVAEVATANPIAQIRPERRRRTAPKILSRSESRRLLDAVFPVGQSLTPSNQLLGERDKTMVQVILDTGIRGDELTNLTAADLVRR